MPLKGVAIESHLFQKEPYGSCSILLKDCDLYLSLDNRHVTTGNAHLTAKISPILHDYLEMVQEGMYMLVLWEWHKGF